MTVREHMIQAGWNPDDAYTVIGDGHAECERVEIKVNRTRDHVTVKARAVVDWSDGTNRPYPEFGWDGEGKGYNVSAFFSVTPE